ncbi:MAG: ATP-binding cassette domain-containing protein [Desulfovibrionaceae bacterium]|nr:ATP-binding cassette domain-containing protein [Desulfovibrionaceae bacterium]
MAEPIIEIKGLGKSFRSKNTEVTALRDINLTVERGDIFGIIGMSGAGKSTLVRCINMLERPTEGTVFFDGRDLGRLSPRELRQIRRSMGMIFQQFNLLMQRSAEANVCFPLEIAGVDRATARKRARDLLELVGLADRAAYYPAQLSGGQKQRVAIARALASDPKVLLCDEATSALDPSTTASILALLKDINRRLGITVVIITHEMHVIEQICTKVAIISDSRIAESGTVEQVFFHPRTDAARKLVLPESRAPVLNLGSHRLYRIVFDGGSSFEPVIANMVLECRTPVNIMFADTRDIDGKAFGQMVVQVPDNDETVRRMVNYVTGQGLVMEEVREV